MRGGLRGPTLARASIAAALAVTFVPSNLRSGELDVVRIPSLRLSLGHTAVEAVALATLCNRASGGVRCAPEDFVDERAHQIPLYVPRFELDRTEVTVASYERCVRAGYCSSHGMRETLEAEEVDPALPVSMVSLDDARDYCAFRSARLPTGAEFEAAARGPSARLFPWGDVHHRGRANGGAPAGGANASDGYLWLAPARALLAGRTPDGVLQLGGNVAEWVEPDGSGLTFAHGGSFAEPAWRLTSSSRRELPRSERRIDVGFRCARTLD